MLNDEHFIKMRLFWFTHNTEISKKVARTCRYYGISRTTYYRWYNRYQEYGVEGLKDRSRRPRFNPRTTPREVVEKIVYLRQYYHFGPSKIEMYLAKYHNIRVRASTIWRILKVLHMNRLP